MRKKFQHVYSRYLRDARYFAQSYLGDAEEAKEVVHDVFLVIWERIDKIDFDKDLLPYILTLTKNRCLNILRKKNRVLREDISSLKHTLSIKALESADTNILTTEIIDKMNISLQEMPPAVKETFLLHREDSLKYREIADKLGVSEKTVEYRMMSALKTLRKHFKEFLILLLGLMVSNM